MKRIKRALTSLLLVALVIAVNPIQAHAEWRGNYESGWWYADGNNSYYTGWKYIGGNWYYFNEQGWMLHDIWVGEYYLGSNGAWKSEINTLGQSATDKLRRGNTIQAGNDPEGAQQIASQNGNSQQSSSSDSHKDYFNKADVHGGTTSSDGTLSQNLQRSGN